MPTKGLKPKLKRENRVSGRRVLLITEETEVCCKYNILQPCLNDYFSEIEQNETGKASHSTGTLSKIRVF